MTTARLGGLVVAGFLLLSGTARATDCVAGSEVVDILIANLTEAPVAASIRQGRSDDAWQTMDIAPGGREIVSTCLEMVLSVASAEFSVTDGAGAVLCIGDSLIPAGAEANLVIEPDGACALKANH